MHRKSGDKNQSSSEVPRCWLTCQNPQIDRALACLAGGLPLRTLLRRSPRDVFSAHTDEVSGEFTVDLTVEVTPEFTGEVTVELPAKFFAGSLSRETA